MAIDRADALKKAEKLLRRASSISPSPNTSAAVEEQPRDWNTRNTLGDLYIRANQPDKAVAQYTADRRSPGARGVLPEGRRDLQEDPQDQARRGIGAAAPGRNFREAGAARRRKGLLHGGREQAAGPRRSRRRRRDRVRLGSLDPADFEARALAARDAGDNGDAAAAAMQYRSMHADLLEQGAAAEATAALREAVRLQPRRRGGADRAGESGGRGGRSRRRQGLSRSRDRRRRIRRC